MHDALQHLNKIYGMEFSECGTIVVAPKHNSYAFYCRHCHKIFMEMFDFMPHVKQEHFDLYDFGKSAIEGLGSIAVYDDNNETSNNSVSGDNVTGIGSSLSTSAINGNAKCTPEWSVFLCGADGPVGCGTSSVLDERQMNTAIMAPTFPTDAVSIGMFNSAVEKEQRLLNNNSKATCMRSDDIVLFECKMEPDEIDDNLNDSNSNDTYSDGVKNDITITQKQKNRFSPDEHRNQNAEEKIAPRLKLREKSKMFPNLTFLSFDADMKHKSKIHKTQLHRCNFCDKNFVNYVALVKHMRHDHPQYKPHECSECDYATCDKHSLQRHIRNSHNAERKCQCPHCNYAARDMYGLNRHLRLHTDETRPFDCAACNKRFNDAKALERHNRKLHNDEALLEQEKRSTVGCKLCCKRFLNYTKLSRHIRACHNEYKPHKCDQCDYASSEKSKLQRHMICHERGGTRPYQCPHCAYAAKHNSTLLVHLRRFCLAIEKKQKIENKVQ